MSSNTDDETPKPINEQPPVDEKREEKAKAKEETKEEKKDNNEKKKTEDAATALERPSTLGSEETEENSASSDEEEKGDAGEVEDDDAPLEEAEDFKIPLKLTKSGRKRATPFPLKVSQIAGGACLLARVCFGAWNLRLTQLPISQFIYSTAAHESALE